MSARGRPPSGLTGADLDGWLEDLAAGTPWRTALETLLRALPIPRAEAVMQWMREGRGAWLALAAARGGAALVVGDALGGAAVALARAGFRVVLLDDDARRLQLAAARDRALADGRLAGVLGGADARLPFADAAFELVLQEECPPGAGSRFGHDTAELLRVTGGELWVVADNRFGYKDSSGRRAEFRVPRPVEYATRVLRPRAGERTLGAHRRALEDPGFTGPKAYALYPHSRDFSQIAALDRGSPELFVGPMERRNWLKTLGYKAGLFPHFTPSYALTVRRSGSRGARPRIDAVLDALAETLGEARPEVEHLVATRGNTAVIHTRVVGRGASEAEGRWTLHVPLSPHQQAQAQRHGAALRELSERFPALPHPESLYEGTLDGLWLGCERRLPGLSAPQLAGDEQAMARLYADLATALAGLVVEQRVTLDDERFEQLIGAKLELVRRYMREPHELAALDGLRAEARTLLAGASFPLVYYHSDVRGKHVQIQPTGELLGLLDWGSSSPADLPYFDLLNLIVHDRKQDTGRSVGEAWRQVQQGVLRPFERAALDAYAEALGLEPEVRRGLEAVYPALVGAMAEGNWDYSRPRWVWRDFFGDH